MQRRAVLALALLAAACPADAAGTMAVVASFTILADLAAQVGGPDTAVASLVAPDGDVHTVQPRPSDLGRLAAAAVAVENGLGLEPWLPRLITASGFRGQRVVASAGITTRTFAENGRNAVDPHVWQNPRNAVRMVGMIAAAFAAADPGHADGYHARAATLRAAILDEDAAIERAYAAIPPERRQIITSHDAFGYYGARYGITVRAAQGINTDTEPTPRDLARLAAQIRRDRVRAVFVENMTDPRIAQALAREAGAVVGAKVYSDSLSPPDGPAPTYLAMLRHNTRLFTEAMIAAAQAG